MHRIAKYGTFVSSLACADFMWVYWPLDAIDQTSYWGGNVLILALIGEAMEEPAWKIL